MLIVGLVFSYFVTFVSLIIFTLGHKGSPYLSMSVVYLVLIYISFFVTKYSFHLKGKHADSDVNVGNDLGIEKDYLARSPVLSSFVVLAVILLLQGWLFFSPVLFFNHPELSYIFFISKKIFESNTIGTRDKLRMSILISIILSIMNPMNLGTLLRFIF
jgi:hypothetical protein